MSIAEAGVVLGVILEATEYVPWIKKRWPSLEKVGFLILVISLVGDWRFQTAINGEQTRQIIDAQNTIVDLSPRYLLMNERIVGALKRYEGQKVVILTCQNFDPLEQEAAAISLESRLREAGWVNGWGQQMSGQEPTDRVLFTLTDSKSGRCSQGIFIEAKATAPPRTRQAAKALATALRSENIAAMDFDSRPDWSYPSALPSPGDLVVVSIGFKGV